MNSTRRYQKVKLAELISQVVRPEKITDVKNEHYITLSSYGKGAHERVIKDEKYPVPFTGYRVSKGQFIYSRIDARNGAYDIIGPELEGFVVSKDFPIYDINIEKVLPRFLLRSVLSDSFIRQVKQSSFGATNRMRIKEEVFENYSISLPTISEQKEMSDTLDLVQSIIGSKERQLSLLDNLIKARFVELFGDKDKYPCEQLNNNVHEMFIGPFGSALKNECFVEEEDGYCIVYEQKHAIKKTMDVPTRYVDETKYLELKRFSVYPGDIIVSCRGTIGEIFVVPEEAPLGIMHPSIMKIRLNTERYDQKFFVLALERYMEEHNNEAKGSGVKMAVTATTLGQELFVVPPMDVQKSFSTFVEQVDKSKVIVRKALDEAQLLFDSLMQQYFG